MNKFLTILLGFLGFGADVILVSSGTAGNAGSAAAELSTYIAAKALEVAELNLVLEQGGERIEHPANSGKTIRLTRMEKFSVATSPTQLTEGISPDARAITIAQVEATSEQYGDLCRISDVASLTAKHPVVQQAINRIGIHAAELKDQLIFNILDAASNTYRPNDRAGDTSLFASDLITYNDLVELNATLATNGAKPLDNGNFMFVTPPMVHAGILRDPDYKASNQLAAPQKMWKGMVDQLGGMDVVKSNSGSFAAVSQATSGQTNKLYSSFAFGRGAYQVTDLQSLEVIVTEPGGQGDPLKQNYLIGYKFMHKSVISNQTWIRRVRSSGVDAVNNP